MTVSGSSSLSCQVEPNRSKTLFSAPPCIDVIIGARELTGTLRWVMMTDVSLPLTAMAVIPEPEMALKAYST